jgi:hypothetical protein
MDLGYVRKLIELGAQESVALEFKAGAALGRTGNAPKELVKDVSGMANGAGGQIVYGISELRTPEGRTIAGPLQPVMDPSITVDWFLQTIASNTQPPVSSVNVHELPVPAQEGGGRVLVVDIAASNTAHQSGLDHRYHQRIGTRVSPMEDFQIRDVMNRRSAPRMEVQLRKGTLNKASDGHSYVFVPELLNTGMVTLDRWLFEVDFPEIAYSDHLMRMQVVNLAQDRVEHAGVPYRRFKIPAAAALPGGAHEIHPGQRALLGPNIGLNDFRVWATIDNLANLQSCRPSILWRLYMPNARPLEGEVPYDSWCEVTSP